VKKKIKKTPTAPQPAQEERGTIEVLILPIRRARTPKQKEWVLNELLRIWLKEPQLRLGQLIDNGIRADGSDLFYKEDGDLIKMLDNWVK
jgi:hypothetical protein